MKVTPIQYDIVWKNPRKNIEQINNILSATGQTDLIVLPEMWSTGFAMDPDTIAENATGPSLSFMQQIAREKDCAVIGSVATADKELFHNRSYFVKPDGSFEYYDKHHLFSYGGENRRYTPGHERKVIEWRGVKILLLICYDLRFPVWARYRDDYDMIVICANWPVSRQHSWEILSQARAMENQCYVIAVNRIGTDEMCEYIGGTMVVNPYGEIIHKCEDRKKEAPTIDIDMEMLYSFRKKFPVLEDADRLD